MKNLFVILFALVIFANNSFAEVYVVDLKKAINDSSAGKEAKDQLEEKFRKKKEALEKGREGLVSMQEDIKKQSSMLSEDALESKITSLRVKEKEIARSFQDYQEEFTKENGSKISKIMEKIYEIIDDIAKEKNYPLILEKNERIVLYADSKSDITDEVVSKLNKEKISF